MSSGLYPGSTSSFGFHSRPANDVATITAYVTRSNSNGVGMEWFEYAPPAISELLRALLPERETRLRTTERANHRLEALFLKHNG